MTTETAPVLTDDSIDNSIPFDGQANLGVALFQFARRVEQAVLQSPEVQQLRKDKARLDSGVIMTHERDEFGLEYMCERRGVNLRAAIDAAMETKE